MSASGDNRGPLFNGIITALVTPFRDDQSVDYDAYEALIERQIAAGVHGLVPVGTTGESATLSYQEHEDLITFCVKVSKGRVKIIAGAGANDTSRAISLCGHAKTVGADGALVVLPYYNRPSAEGVFMHFKAIQESVAIPVIAYDVPSRTGIRLGIDTWQRLLSLPNIMGLKDATGEIERVALMRLMAPNDHAFLSGDDPSFIGYMAQGGHGVISVASNIAPELMVALYHAIQTSDRAITLGYQDRLIRLYKALFSDNSPAPTKYLLASEGHMKPHVRLPLAPCSDASIAALKDAYVTLSS
jgi:4-hydroxy-tetrahydrodipicolinate synthase